MDTIDENELSAPIQIWEKILYDNQNEMKLDIYFTENGFPSEIHDRYGSAELDTFLISLINLLKAKNDCKEISRVYSAGFAIPYNEKNCDEFEFSYKDVKYNIRKKSIKINLLNEIL